MKGKLEIILLLLVLTISSILTYPLMAAEPRLTASAAFLLDYNTGQVLLSKAADDPCAMASLTKVMTMYIIFDALKAGEISLEHICHVSRKAYDISLGTSRMWLYHGDMVVFEEILKGIAVVSGNDASVVAAEEICDSEEEFVIRMNAKAVQLGMSGTQYRNVHGLDEDGHYSTARDTAILGAALLRDHPEAIYYLTLPEMSYFSFPSPMYNTNQLLLSYEGADGIKTGTTDDAGYCLLGSALREDVRLIAVILDADSDGLRYSEIKSLLDYGFGDDFQRLTILHSGDIVDSKLQISRGALDQVGVAVASDVNVVIRTGTAEELIWHSDLPKQAVAPIDKGTKVGTLTVSYDDQEISVVDLLTAEDSGEAGFFKMMGQRIVDFFRGLFRIVRP